MLPLPTLNFCAFACCEVTSSKSKEKVSKRVQAPERITQNDSSLGSDLEYLIAIPGSDETQVDLYHLPSEKKVGMVPAPKLTQGISGILMAIEICYKENVLLLLAAYEGGAIAVFKRVTEIGSWQQCYGTKSHSQPVLSIDVSPAADSFFSSGADAMIFKHPLNATVFNDTPIKESQTRHSGQQGLRVRSDGRIIATAGWDKRVRVYSAKSLHELAVLKWHKEGCYAVAFAEVESPNLGSEQSAKGETIEPIQSVAITKVEENTVAQIRQNKAMITHWLAAGAKDGKISLWDIF